MPGSACISRSTPPRRAAAAAVKPGKGRKRGGGGAHAHNGVHEGLAQDAVDDGRLADAPGAVEERLLLHATADQDKRRHKSAEMSASPPCEARVLVLVRDETWAAWWKASTWSTQLSRV